MVTCPPRATLSKAAEATDPGPGAASDDAVMMHRFAPTPLVISRTCVWAFSTLGSRVWVAPHALASWRRELMGSIAIRVDGLSMLAAITAVSPIWPNPKIATWLPGVMGDRSIARRTVGTVQHNSAPSSNDSGFGSSVSTRSGASKYSAHAPSRPNPNTVWFKQRLVWLRLQ